MGSLLLPLGLDAHTTLGVPSKHGLSVSPSPVEVLQSIPAGLQSSVLWGFLLPLLDPQVGKPDVGLRTFTTVGRLLFLKNILFIYLFLSVLGLCCCVWAFSSGGEQGLLFVVVRGFLIVVVSLVAEHGL